MRPATALASFLLGSLVLGGCGPDVNEMRLVSAAAKGPNCELDFVNIEMKDVVPGGPLEILGHVMLSEEGVRDPLAREYRAKVRPRACAMGGEAVGVMMSHTATPTGFSAGATMIDYAVVRKRPAPSPKASGPTKF
jgi:hypothetical protein